MPQHRSPLDPSTPAPAPGSPPTSPDPGTLEPAGRPVLPPTIGQRYDDLRSRMAVGRGRAVAAIAGVILAGTLGWWLLRPPAPAVEQTLPMASATGSGSGPGSENGSASPSASAGGGSDGVPVTDAAGTTDSDAAPAQLVVHAAGAVVRPGVYKLPAGSRVDDLVTAAGGLAPNADGGRLNLAAPLLDGQRVYVPAVGQAEVPEAVDGDSPPGTPPPSGSPPAAAGTTAPAAPVNLNTATLEQLDTLPGVGPSTAQAILDHRQQKGRFNSVDELLDVRGIGDAKMAQLRDRVTV